MCFTQENIEAKIIIKRNFLHPYYANIHHSFECDVFSCPYCNKSYLFKDQAIQCLNSHNIVFEIYQLDDSNEDYKKEECYKSMDMFFEDFEEAKKFVDNYYNCKIYIKKFNT